MIRLRTLLIHIVAWTIAVIWIIPFAGVFMAALRPFQEVTLGWWNVSPFTLTGDNLVKGLLELGTGFRNSFLIAIPATLIPIFVAAFAGYGFARFRFPIRDYIFLSIVILMAVPQQMVAIPVFRLMLDLDLIDSLMGLILLHSAWGLPWIILFMRNFFVALPPEVEEAARVDGASDFGIFFKIVLPMAIPAFASAAVLQFMWVWNDFFFALLLLFSDSNKVVTQAIAETSIGQLTVDWSLASAMSFLVMLVPLGLYVALQKYYIRGMIGWTVKG